VPLIESHLKTGCHDDVTSFQCLSDAGGGKKDISKFLDRGELTQMRGSAQLEIGITEAYTITMTSGWIEITLTAGTKYIHRDIIGVTNSLTQLCLLQHLPLFK
jgi:hypothetical protein